MGPQLPPFGSVEAVTSTSHVPGWLRDGFLHHATGLVSDPVLIVDDVLTTGASMEEARAGRPARGMVLFSRMSPWPAWITPFLVKNPWIEDAL